MAKLIRLPHRALLSLKGADSANLLQGLVTNDIRKVTDSSAVASFLLNTKGRIVEDLLIYKQKDDYLVECSEKTRGDIKKLLEKYRMRKKVDIIESDESVLVTHNASEGIADPRLASLGRRLFGKEEGNAGVEVYHDLRFSLGVAEGEIELEGMLPFQANGDALPYVSLDKGCYIGQELTARTAHTGVIRRRILPFTCESAVSGEVVDEEGRKVGSTIASSASRGLALLSLNAITRKLSVNGTVIQPFKPDWMTSQHFANGEKK